MRRRIDDKLLVLIAVAVGVIASLILWLHVMNVIIFQGPKIVLHQPDNQIVSIDLVYSPTRVVYSLQEEEIAPFLKELRELRYEKHLNPMGSLGTLYIQITYRDGSVEILGDTSCSYRTGDQEEHDGWYYIPVKDLSELFSGYTDRIESWFSP